MDPSKMSGKPDLIPDLIPHPVRCESNNGIDFCENEKQKWPSCAYDRITTSGHVTNQTFAMTSPVRSQCIYYKQGMNNNGGSIDLATTSGLTNVSYHVLADFIPSDKVTGNDDGGRHYDAFNSFSTFSTGQTCQRYDPLGQTQSFGDPYACSVDPITTGESYCVTKTELDMTSCSGNAYSMRMESPIKCDSDCDCSKGLASVTSSDDHVIQDNLSSTNSIDYHLDLVRKRRRREQNRIAARKCREKKKENVDNMLKEYKNVLKENEKLHQEVTNMEVYVSKILKVVKRHRSNCSVPCRLPSRT